MLAFLNSIVVVIVFAVVLLMCQREVWLHRLFCNYSRIDKVKFELSLLLGLCIFFVFLRNDWPNSCSLVEIWAHIALHLLQCLLKGPVLLVPAYISQQKLLQTCHSKYPKALFFPDNTDRVVLLQPAFLNFLVCCKTFNTSVKDAKKMCIYAFNSNLYLL